MDMEKLIKKFKQAQIEALYVENRDEARKKALEIIENKREMLGLDKKDLKVSWGGSVTLDECGVRDAVSSEYNALNPYAISDPQKSAEAKRQALLSDIFLMSSNAITENGELVNIDGNGNRLGALIHGPRTVIIVAGKNKITPNVESAFERVKKIACVKNAIRLNRQTPCAKNGVCAECKVSGATICAHTVVTRFSTIPDRIKLIIVGEELGY